MVYHTVSWCCLNAQPTQAVRKAPRRPTKAELLTYAQRHNVPVQRQLRKSDILDALVEACGSHRNVDNE